MAQCSLAFRSNLVLGAPTPLFDIRTSATDAPRITEISGFTINASAASFVLGLGTPASLGLAVTNALSFSPYETNSPSGSLAIGLDWMVRPTIPSKFIRRIACGANFTSTNFRFLFPNGISISPSSSIALWVLTSSAGLAFPISAEIVIEADV